MDTKQQTDDLGQPGEIRQYDRTDGPDTVRGDELNPNRETDVTPIYLTGDSTLQTPEEDAKDRSTDPNSKDRMTASNDDLNEPIPPRTAGDSNMGTGDRSNDDNADAS